MYFSILENKLKILEDKLNSEKFNAIFNLYKKEGFEVVFSPLTIKHYINELKTRKMTLLRRSQLFVYVTSAEVSYRLMMHSLPLNFTKKSIEAIAKSSIDFSEIVKGIEESENILRKRISLIDDKKERERVKPMVAILNIYALMLLEIKTADTNLTRWRFKDIQKRFFQTLKIKEID